MRRKCIYRGLPFEGDEKRLELLKRDDPDDMHPQTRRRVRVQVIDMDSPVDVRLYQSVCEEVARGWAQILLDRFERKPDGGWEILFKWLELYCSFADEDPEWNDIRRFGDGESADMAEPVVPVGPAPGEGPEQDGETAD